MDADFVPYWEHLPEGYGGIFNLFTGFTSKYVHDFVVDGEVVKTIKQNIMHMCRGNRKLYKKTISWLGSIVENPHNRLDDFMMIRGETGFVNWLFGMFSPHYSTLYNGVSDLIRKDNDMLMNAVFTVIIEDHLTASKMSRIERKNNEDRVIIKFDNGLKIDYKNCNHFCILTRDDGINVLYDDGSFNLGDDLAVHFIHYLYRKTDH